MKRLIVAVSMLALCMALIGCTSNSQAPESTASSSDSQETSEVVDYSTGVHHAEITIKGYKDPIELEIYSDSAPRSAEGFCKLVEQGYYNKKTLYWILNGLYVRMGSTKQDNDNLVAGEYKESEFDNSNSLRSGSIALARAEDGTQSDASSFIIFLSDASYLDGKYAGFGKVTEGLDTLKSIANLTESTDSKKRIRTKKSGKIANPKKCPVIKSIEMVD